MKIKTNTLAFWVFVLAYIFCFGFISVKKFNAFGYSEYDLAVHSLSVWNILHGATYNSIVGLPILGNHIHLILFLLAPLYALLAHPLTLLFLQTAALGLGALPLYKLSKRLLDKNWALLISLLYLFYPALAYTNLFEFHPTAFSTLFLILSFYYYTQGSFPRFITFIVLSMFCQENIPPAIILLGVVALFNRRPLKWAAVPIALGALYFIAAILILSILNNNTVQYPIIYEHLGNTPLNIIANIFTHPGLIFKTLFRKECLLYLGDLFMPLAFVPILSPLTLLPSLTFFLQHLLSNGYSLSIHYHYTAELIPFIFISFIYGIKFLLKNAWLRNRQSIIKIALLSIFLAGNFYIGPYIGQLPRILRPTPKESAYLNSYRKKLIATVPPQAAVISTIDFLPYLTRRRFLYSLHNVYTGYYTLSRKKYPTPENIEYALIYFNDPGTFKTYYSPYNYRNLQRFLLGGNWQAKDYLDSVVLFKKNLPSTETLQIFLDPEAQSIRPGAEGSYMGYHTSLSNKKGGSNTFDLCQIIDKLPGEIENSFQVNIDGAIELLGYDRPKYNQEDILDITFYWRCLNPTEEDINILFELEDKNDRVIWRKSRAICYRIFPTNSWVKGQAFKDKCRISLFPMAAGMGCKLKVRFFDYRTGRLCGMNTKADNPASILLKL